MIAAIRTATPAKPAEAKIIPQRRSVALLQRCSASSPHHPNPRWRRISALIFHPPTTAADHAGHAHQRSLMEPRPAVVTEFRRILTAVVRNRAQRDRQHCRRIGPTACRLPKFTSRATAAFLPASGSPTPWVCRCWVRCENSTAELARDRAAIRTRHSKAVRKCLIHTRRSRSCAADVCIRRG